MQKQTHVAQTTWPCEAHPTEYGNNNSSGEGFDSHWGDPVLAFL